MCARRNFLVFRNLEKFPKIVIRKREIGFQFFTLRQRTAFRKYLASGSFLVLVNGSFQPMTDVNILVNSKQIMLRSSGARTAHIDAEFTAEGALKSLKIHRFF